MPALAITHDVLDLWFGALTPDGMTQEDRSALWWSKSDATDALLRARFAEHVESALAGHLDALAETPEGRLALIILLDQLTRNIYRATSRAFAGDEQARRLCLEGLERAHDRALAPIQRVFFYMPLEHAEDVELQASCCTLFEALCESAPPSRRETFEGYLEFARRHREIVERFGRFPHRNAILGRESTPEEAAFLTQPGSSF